jgi:hypothetical protein
MKLVKQALKFLKQIRTSPAEHFAKALSYKNDADRVFIADELRKAGLK